MTAPTNIEPPVASGWPKVGQTLTTTNGIWSTDPPPDSFTYQWYSADTEFGQAFPIIGATGPTVVIGTADRWYVCRVTATNVDGSTSVDSNRVYVSAVVVFDIAVVVADLLASFTEITNIVGTRIATDRLPQAWTEPAIVFWVISETARDSFGGPIGFDAARVQVNAYDIGRAKANHLRLIVRDAIAGYSGTNAGAYVKGVTQESGLSMVTERVAEGTDNYRFAARQDFRFSYCSAG